jgi:membrane associated rhomboid family serine protease
MVGCAMVCGDRMVLAFFVIPTRLKYFAAFCLALDVLVLIGTTGLAEAAHLGGAVCGAIYLKLVWWRQRRLAGVARGTARARSRIDGLEFMDDGRR